MLDAIGLILLGMVIVTVMVSIYYGGIETGRSEAADAAVSDDPPKWWVREKIFAEARKQAAQKGDD